MCPSCVPAKNAVSSKSFILLARLTSHSLNTLSDLFSNGETLSALISSILRDLSDADRIQQPETVEPIHIIQKP